MGGRLPWSALSSFIFNLRPDSALAREMNDYSGWESTLKTNLILADIYDLLQALVLSFGKGKNKFKSYPRPGKTKDNHRKIGSDPMTPDELRKWYFKENEDG